MSALRRTSALFGFLALAIALPPGCASPPQYFQVSVGPLSQPTGTNCGGNSDLITWSGVTQAENWSIYPAPNSQYLLEGALPGEIMTGTLKGSQYTFTGTSTDTNTTGGTSNQVTNTVNYTITLTTAGPGFSGTLSESISCSSATGMDCNCDTTSGVGCLSANGQNFNSMNGMNFSCSEGATVAGTLLSNAVPQHAD